MSDLTPDELARLAVKVFAGPSGYGTLGSRQPLKLHPDLVKDFEAIAKEVPSLLSAARENVRLTAACAAKDEALKGWADFFEETDRGDDDPLEKIRMRCHGERLRKTIAALADDAGQSLLAAARERDELRKATAGAISKAAKTIAENFDQWRREANRSVPPEPGWGHSLDDFRDMDSALHMRIVQALTAALGKATP